MVTLRQLVRMLQREGLYVRDQGRHGGNPERAVFGQGGIFNANIVSGEGAIQ